jgi:CRP-like cAMP-binding protein
MNVAELLSRSEIFSELPREVLGEIACIGRELRLSKGEFVFRLGDLSEDVFIMEEGLVSLGFEAPPREASKGGAIDESGQVFGWGALAEGTNYRILNAITVEETKLIAIRGVELMRLLESHPDVGFVVVRKLLGIILNRMVSVAAT